VLRAAEAAPQKRQESVMANTSATFSTQASRSDRPSGALAEIRDFWRQFFSRAFDPYRPELHYMRGPGPAWRAKQAARD
jgi:hypothetical protein